MQLINYQINNADKNIVWNGTYIFSRFFHPAIFHVPGIFCPPGFYVQRYFLTFICITGDTLAWMTNIFIFYAGISIINTWLEYLPSCIQKVPNSTTIIFLNIYKAIWNTNYMETINKNSLNYQPHFIYSITS